MRRTALVVSGAYVALLASVRLIEEATSSDSAIVADLYHTSDDLYRKAQRDASAPAHALKFYAMSEALLQQAMFHTQSVHGSVERIARFDVARRQRRLQQKMHALETRLGGGATGDGA